MDCPYSDDYMVYDMNMHMYVLTEKYVREVLGINLDMQVNVGGDENPSTLTERFLKKVSRTVYRFIYQHSQSEAWIELLLAAHEPLRERVKEMLAAQTEYAMQNDFLGNQSGINMIKGNVLNINALRGRAKVADEVEQLANETIPGFGYSLTYVGMLPCVPLDAYRKGY